MIESFELCTLKVIKSKHNKTNRKSDCTCTSTTKITHSTLNAMRARNIVNKPITLVNEQSTMLNVNVNMFKFLSPHKKT